jgi:hypothetical protein
MAVNWSSTRLNISYIYLQKLDEDNTGEVICAFHHSETTRTSSSNRGIISEDLVINHSLTCYNQNEEHCLSDFKQTEDHIGDEHVSIGISEETAVSCDNDNQTLDLPICYNQNKDFTPDFKQSDTEEKRSFFNEAFDEQFETIMNILQENAKERDGDMLADDTDTSVLFDMETTSHFGSVVMDDHDDVSVTLEAKETPANDEQNDPSCKPVFDNSPHSLGVTVLLICCFMIRFQLPDEALSYFLRILACILPHGHRLMGSLYHFRKFINQFTHQILPTITYHCNNCYETVGRKTKKCPSCEKSLVQSGSVAYFLH